MRPNRRTVLATGSTVATIPGLVGCLSRSGSDSLEELTVAYVPIYPNVQHFVMEDAAYYDELPVPVVVERFSDGPAVVQAFAGDEVDVAFFGITPAMVLIDRGKRARVLAANSRNGFKIVGTAELAERYDASGSDPFERFEAAEGKRPIIGAPTDGSVPDVVLRFWVEEELGYDDLRTPIEKSQLPPARVPQAMERGDLDGAIVQEPFATIVADSDGFRELTWSGAILPDHPVTATLVHDRVTEGEPDVARALVEQHVRATRLAIENPDTAADHAANVIGDGVSRRLAREAMESDASDFVSDPTAVTERTNVMAEYVAALGNTDTVVSADRLFDPSVYDAVTA